MSAENPAIQKEHEALVDLLRRYHNQGLLEMPHASDEDLLANILGAAGLVLVGKYGHSLRETRFNQKPAIDTINIYCFKADPEGALTEFLDNCTYVGFRNIIICDWHFIDRFQDGPALREAIEKAKASDQDRAMAFAKDNDISHEFIWGTAAARHRNLWLWVLLHELGHLAHRHQALHFRFGSQPASARLRFDVAARNAPAGKISFSDEEDQADQFMFDVLRSFGTEGPASGAWAVGGQFQSGLNAYIYREARRFLLEQGQPPDLWGSTPIKVFTRRGASHAPTLLRALRLNLLLITEFGIEKPDFMQNLLARVVIEVVD
jgi:hypothetical protein